MQRLEGSSCNFAETQQPRFALEGARQTTPPSERKGCARVAQKARRTPDRPLAPCGGLGALPATLSRPSDLSSHSRGLDKQPLRPNEKDARGSHKKPGELLIALSLRAEALPATLPRPSDLGSHPKGSQQTNPHARGAYKKPGEHLTALSLRAEAKGFFM